MSICLAVRNNHWRSLQTSPSIIFIPQAGISPRVSKTIDAFPRARGPQASRSGGRRRRRCGQFPVSSIVVSVSVGSLILGFAGRLLWKGDEPGSCPSSHACFKASLSVDKKKWHIPPLAVPKPAAASNTHTHRLSLQFFPTSPVYTSTVRRPASFQADVCVPVGDNPQQTTPVSMSSIALSPVTSTAKLQVFPYKPLEPSLTLLFSLMSRRDMFCFFLPAVLVPSSWAELPLS